MMSPMFAEIALALTAGVLIFLPFIPTLREWLQPTDAAPLPIDQNAKHEMRHFADSLRGLMTTLIGASPTREQLREYGKGLFYQGKQVTIFHDDDGLDVAQTADMLEAAGKLGQISVFAASAKIQPGCDTLADIYALKDLWIGDNVRLRAGCALGHLEISPDVLVHRWIDAHTINAGQNLIVHGRITALNSIRFAHNTQFVRGGAPIMIFGDSVSGAVVAHSIPGPHVTQRFVLDGDATITEDIARNGNFVIRGSGRMNSRCSITGSIKAHDFLRIGNDVNVAGSVVANKGIVMGERCAALGPLISEQDIIIGPDCLIGSPEFPTTITCRKLVIAQGVVIHGVITTQDSAHVVFEEIPLAV
jgi:predicted acyltransferase (DUF342 family)